MNNDTRHNLESQLSLLENTVRVIFDVHSNVARRLRSINSHIAAGQEPPALPDNYQGSIAEYSASVALSTRNLLEEFMNIEVPTAPVPVPIALSTRNLLEEFMNIEVPTAPVPVPIALSTRNLQELFSNIEVPIVPVRVNVIPPAGIAIRQPLSREIFDSRSEYECGICLEAHLNGYTVTCECNHRFGKKCFNSWTKTCARAKKATTCPTCRQPVKKMRVPFITKAKPTNVIPEPEPLIGAPHVIEF